MKITTDYISIPASDGGSIRAFVAEPQLAGRYPGIIFYSDIFQLTGPMVRACSRLAGYGFVVAAPEIYRRIEPSGTVIPFDDEGRDRGMNDAAATLVSHFDEDCRAVLDFLAANPSVAEARLGAAGFCIGGHLAFRAAFQQDVRATVCFYGTGIHNGRLGKEDDSRSLERICEIRGELLLVWGEQDPHIPAEGRTKIEEALAENNIDYSRRAYQAEHAFMRDIGPRFDPEAMDDAFGEMIIFYRRIFGSTGDD
jgi:carboxymethylenebutenolidase